MRINLNNLNMLPRMAASDILRSVFFAVLFIVALTPSGLYPYQLTGPILNSSILVACAIIASVSYLYRTNKTIVLSELFRSPFHFFLAVLILVSVARFGINIWTIYFIELFLLSALVFLLIQNGLVDELHMRIGLSVAMVYVLLGLLFAQFDIMNTSGLSLNSNITAMFLAALTPFVAGQARPSRLILLYGIVTLAVVALESRTGLIGLLLGFLANLWRQYGADWRKVVYSRMAAPAVLLLLVFIAALVFFQQKKTESTGGRMIIWENTWQIIQRQPMLGYGIGAYAKALNTQLADYFSKPRDISIQDNFYNPISVAYNDPLQLIVENGVIGLLFWLAIGITVTRSKTRGFALSPTGISLGCMAVMGFTNSLLYAAPCGLLLVAVIPFALPQRVNSPLPSVYIGARALGAASLTLTFLFLVTRHERALRQTWTLAQDKQTSAREKLSRLRPFKRILANNEFYWKEVAQNFYAAQRHEDALQALDRVLRLNGWADAYALRSAIYEKLNRRLEAHENLRMAHATAPGNLDFKYRWFESCRQSGDSTTARLIAQEIVQYDKKRSEAITFYKNNAQQYLYAH